jgi:uncharacterized protein YkwD
MSSFIMVTRRASKLPARVPLRLSTLGLLVCTWLVLPSMAADNSGVFRTSNQKTFSSQLGADTVPTCVVLNNVRHMGIYIASAPSTELGRNMRLSRGMVLLTVDGYSITSGRIADSWIGHRPAKKPLVFTYAFAQDGKPSIQTGQIDGSAVTPVSVAATAPTAATAPPSRSSAATAADNAKPVAQPTDLAAYCISMINESRKSGGLNPVQQDSALSRFGSDYAEYLAKNGDKFELKGSNNPHVDLAGRGPQERAQQAGLGNFLDESIGRSSRTLGDARQLAILHQQMMADVHRAIIMNPEARLVGIGIARGPNRLYLTEEFGR